jgi:hypothetical protein
MKHIFMLTKEDVEKICELYKTGMNCHEIAPLFNRKKEWIQEIIRNKGLMRDSEGIKIEKMVIKKLQDVGHEATRMPGNCEYDAVVDGNKVEIKSAHKKLRDRSISYCFELNHRFRIEQIPYKNRFDLVYMVFLDEDRIPVYSIPSENIHIKKRLFITNPKTSIHKTDFVMFLE